MKRFFPLIIIAMMAVVILLLSVALRNAREETSQLKNELAHAKDGAETTKTLAREGQRFATLDQERAEAKQKELEEELEKVRAEFVQAVRLAEKISNQLNKSELKKAKPSSGVIDTDPDEEALKRLKRWRRAQANAIYGQVAIIWAMQTWTVCKNYFWWLDSDEWSRRLESRMKRGQ